MKQKISVYAYIEKGAKTLLLKRAQGNENIIGKLELPGGPLPWDSSPYSAIVDYIRQQLGVEPSVVQLHDVIAYRSVYDSSIQRIDIIYLAALPEAQPVQLSARHGEFKWTLKQEIQQNDVTEATSNLLGLIAFEEQPPQPQTLDARNAVASTTKRAIIYCDGGSRGNPGPSASGFVILDENKQIIEEGGAYLGITTNNQAEYHAVRLALEAALKHNVLEVQLRLDSLLVVNQMKGVYKIKSRDLWPIHERIKELIHHFKHVAFNHVRREFNKEADAMVNKILDEHSNH